VRHCVSQPSPKRLQSQPDVAIVRADDDRRLVWPVCCQRSVGRVEEEVPVNDCPSHAVLAPLTNVDLVDTARMLRATVHVASADAVAGCVDRSLAQLMLT
jgi:hypothetical protein